MKIRIVKSEIYNAVAFIPQYKPCLLVQVLQLNFDWRCFYKLTVKDVDRHIIFFRIMENALNYIESGKHRDRFSGMTVWQDGKAVNDDRS